MDYKNFETFTEEFKAADLAVILGMKNGMGLIDIMQNHIETLAEYEFTVSDEVLDYMDYFYHKLNGVKKATVSQRPPFRI